MNKEKAIFRFDLSNCRINFNRGLEKENLRISSDDARLSLTSHPLFLGSSYSHKNITTDFSESMLEFVTSPSDSCSNVTTQLYDLHKITYSLLDSTKEALWPFSMPCDLSKNDIPIAKYGNFAKAKEKEVYRQGLALRYGKKMQVISGIHFNFSFNDCIMRQAYNQSEHFDKLPFQDFVSQMYFDCIRQSYRYNWLLIYLFGASPVVHESFIDKLPHPDFFQKNKDYYFRPYATSLRVSNMGYSNDKTTSLVSFNGLDNYIHSVKDILQHPFGEAYYGNPLNSQQLNDRLLQNESELYSQIRPKTNTIDNERPLYALWQRGVEYLELRVLDLNPFSPIGMDKDQLYFLDLFFFWCLSKPSPYFEKNEINTHMANFQEVALNGLKPNLNLMHNNTSISLQDYGLNIINEIELLVAQHPVLSKNTNYIQAIDTQRNKLKDSTLTPSFKVLNELKSSELSFLDYGLQLAKEHSNLLSTQITYKYCSPICFQREAFRSIQATKNQEQTQTTLEELLLQQERMLDEI